MTSSSGEWDLIVAGAGPAGCALAAKVAGGGAKVLMLEKMERLGEGRSWILGVEESVFEEADVPRPSEEAMWVEWERSVMQSPDGEYSIELKQSPVIDFRNDIYVEELGKWARESGAEIRMNCAVLGPVVEEGRVRGVRFRDADGETLVASAPLVADCTGMPGSVRRGTPGEWGLAGDLDPSDIILARREVRKVDAEAASRVVEDGALLDRVRVDKVSVMAAWSTKSYYMDIEEGYIDILVGGKLGGEFPTADEWFKEILGEWSFVGEKISGDGGPITIRRPWESLVGDGLLLLGESACQVIPMHGSGTASALISADLASKTISRALENEEYDRSALWDYCYKFQSGRGALLAYFYGIQRYINRQTGPDMVKMLKKGLVTADDVYDGLVPRPVEAGPLELAGKAVKGAAIFPKLIGFARAGLRANKIMKHYQRYPSTFSQEALDSWIAGIPDVT